MSPHPTDIIRPLGAVEGFLWLFDHSSPKHLCLIAELTGPTTKPQLQVCLRRPRSQEPARWIDPAETRP